METLQARSATPQSRSGSAGDELAARRRGRERRLDESHVQLRCVSSGYLTGGCSCPATVPGEAALAAWGRERREGAGGDRFFQFAWQGQVWLGYGLAGGGVRGVYCPEHNAQRTERFYMQSAPAARRGGAALSA